MDATSGRRRIPPSRSSGPRTETADRILDAAQECIVAGGLGQTSISQIAARAGVSRVTVYRYWDDFPAIVNALLERALNEIVWANQLGEYTLESLVESLVQGLDTMRVHELVDALHRHDREILSVQVATAWVDTSGVLARLLWIAFRRTASRDPRMRQDNLDRAIRMTISLIEGTVLDLPQLAADMGTEGWKDEVRRLMYGYLTTGPREAHTRA